MASSRRLIARAAYGVAYWPPQAREVWTDTHSAAGVEEGGISDWAGPGLDPGLDLQLYPPSSTRGQHA